MNRYQSKYLKSISLLLLLLVSVMSHSIFAEPKNVIEGLVQDEHSSLPISGVTTIQVQDAPDINPVKRPTKIFSMKDREKRMDWNCY